MTTQKFDWAPAVQLWRGRTALGLCSSWQVFESKFQASPYALLAAVCIRLRASAISRRDFRKISDSKRSLYSAKVYKVPSKSNRMQFATISECPLPSGIFVPPKSRYPSISFISLTTSEACHSKRSVIGCLDRVRRSPCFGADDSALSWQRMLTKTRQLQREPRTVTVKRLLRIGGAGFFLKPRTGLTDRPGLHLF